MVYIQPQLFGNIHSLKFLNLPVSHGYMCMPKHREAHMLVQTEQL
uniref:Uncharacterized protein n=1 Tax=Rhizophora mucronata TaxID=61149 RepID=A0A2P2N2Q8_RHIMU